ncbi:hypothetical protein pdam_00002544, partial [Pocillopora damicornis]
MLILRNKQSPFQSSVLLCMDTALLSRFLLGDTSEWQLLNEISFVIVEQTFLFF